MLSFVELVSSEAKRFEGAIFDVAYALEGLHSQWCGEKLPLDFINRFFTHSVECAVSPGDVFAQELLGSNDGIRTKVRQCLEEQIRQFSFKPKNPGMHQQQAVFVVSYAYACDSLRIYIGGKADPWPCLLKSMYWLGVLDGWNGGGSKSAQVSGGLAASAKWSKDREKLEEWFLLNGPGFVSIRQAVDAYWKQDCGVGYDTVRDWISKLNSKKQFIVNAHMLRGKRSAAGDLGEC